MLPIPDLLIDKVDPGQVWSMMKLPLPDRQAMTEKPDSFMPYRQLGDKFCTQCKTSCPAEGGIQLVAADGMHQRWICKRCKDHAQAAPPSSRQKPATE